MSSPTSGPALHRRRLGRALRDLREARCLRLEDVAIMLDVATSTVSRIETGGVPLRASYLRILLDHYGVTESSQRQELAELARRGQRASWWAGWKEILPPGAGRYLDLEHAASHVSAYRTQVVPGLLQTPAYARAVLRIRRPDLSPDQVSALLALQQRRRELHCNSGASLHVILDEAALVRVLGPADVMTAQHQYLLDLMSQPSVHLQVASLDWPCSVLSPALTVLRFDEMTEPDIACWTGTGGQVVFSKNKGDADTARSLMASLSESALSSADSANLIVNLIERNQPTVSESSRRKVRQGVACRQQKPAAP